MKKFIFLLAGATFFLLSPAQDTLSTNLYQHNDRLGIGNAYPDFLLHIRENATNISLHPRQFIMLENTNNTEHASVAMAMRSGLGENLSEGSFGITSRNYAAMAGLDGIAYVYNRDNGIALRADNEYGTIRMLTGGDTPYHERMRIDANGRIGIGTSTPNHKLEIIGEEGQDVPLAIKNNRSATINQFVSGDMGTHHGGLTIRRSRGSYDSPSSLLSGDRVGGLYSRAYFDADYQVNASIELYVGEDAGNGSYSSTIRFLTTGVGEVERTERMRIAENGTVGIGTQSPAARLQVADGDIFISDIEKGIIMKSPDGNCWRGTLDNSGMLNFSPIECPDGSGPNKSQSITTPESSIRIYPNPSRNMVTIDITDNAGDLELSVFTSDGKLLEVHQVNARLINMDMSAYSKGLYIFQLTNHNGSILTREKFILQ